MLRLCLYAHVRLLCAFLHARPRVQQAPGVPCALFSLGETICKARAKRAAGRRSRTRDVSNVIASKAKQSILPLRRTMDCFASLAMTVVDADERAEKPRRTGSPACAGDDGTGVIARSVSDEAIHAFFARRDGLLRGARHRARIRATRDEAYGNLLR